ncbi:MAG: FecR protein [Lacunisphaera sp.]|nr:FecR protein [Lacunisphaera sp.]
MVLSLNAFGQTALGQIKAAKVEGDVTRVVNGANVQVKNGDTIVETDVITTGPTGSIVLVFLNGSSVKLGAKSRLAIDEFKMDPLDPNAPMPDFNDRTKPEPTKSKTALNLAYGEMVGAVKPLNTSSVYSIKTPAGAAGIRGTIYRIVYTPTSDGKAFFTVSTAEGKVVMQGVTTVDIPIVAGKEVVVQVDVQAATTPGTTPTSTPTAPVIVTDIPPETTVLITAATNTIVAAIQTTTFTPTPTGTDTGTGTKTEEKKEEPKKEETPPTQPDTTPPPTPPTPPVPTTPTLTSGAGG